MIFWTRLSHEKKKMENGLNVRFSALLCDEIQLNDRAADTTV